jgi:hypothetical protein
MIISHKYVRPTALSLGIVPSGRYDLYLGYFRLNNPEKSVHSGSKAIYFVYFRWFRFGKRAARPLFCLYGWFDSYDRVLLDKNVLGAGADILFF